MLTFLIFTSPTFSTGLDSWTRPKSWVYSGPIRNSDICKSNGSLIIKVSPTLKIMRLELSFWIMVFWLCDYRGFQFEGSVKRWMNQNKPLIMNDLEWFKNPQNFEAVSMVNLKLTLTLMILLQNEENITVGNPQNYWGLTWSYFIWHHTLFYILYNPLFLSLIVYSSRSCISLTGCTCNLLRLTIVIYYW